MKSIKGIIFDLDGMVYLTNELFSDRFPREFGLKHADVVDFLRSIFLIVKMGKKIRKKLYKSTI
jgi:hypothetical protein